MRSTICLAITERKVIQFDYHGGPRKVEPFCYGLNKTGNEVLRGYQIGGHSERGESVGWRLFRASDISGITVTPKHYTGWREGYTPNDSAMTTIHCHV